ncbi:alpha/beta hydrolase-fold protein [Bacillus cereus]|nr:alpha/beta hydrolase-fold protein [Bacillus cereus]MDA2169387.1 alpha/beta hydrolase-fold protein [Bacillus cereus]
MNELKPFIDNKYRTLKDNTAMAGISLGGTYYHICYMSLSSSIQKYISIILCFFP